MPPALDLGPRRQQLKCSEISIENRDTFDLLIREDGRHVGFVSLQLRNFSCNLYRLSYSTDLQSCVSTYCCVGVHAHTRNIVGFKSGRFDMDFVTVGDEVRDRVIPTLVRGGLFRRAFSGVCHSDFGPRHCVPLRVRHGSNKVSVYRLPEGRACTKPKRKTKNQNPR